MKKKEDPARNFFGRFSAKVTRLAGKPGTFILALLIILVWSLSGPLFHFSDTWQLVINTGTTIITFLMVFIIQQTQNKDTMALHLKLNELIASNKGCSNRLIDVEDLSEQELETLKQFYIQLSQLAKKEMNIHASHSLDEAHDIHESKKHQE